jgi:uracil-DNA glycosylase
MSAADNVKLEAGWKAALHEEFEKPYMPQLGDFLRAAKGVGVSYFYSLRPLLFT